MRNAVEIKIYIKINHSLFIFLTKYLYLVKNRNIYYNNNNNF